MLSLAGAPKCLCQQEAWENNQGGGISSPSLLCQAGPLMGLLPRCPLPCSPLWWLSLIFCTALGRFHGGVWLGWQVGSDAISPLPPPTSRPDVKCCFLRSAPKIKCKGGAVIMCWFAGVPDCASNTATLIAHISAGSGDWCLCNPHLSLCFLGPYQAEWETAFKPPRCTLWPPPPFPMAALFTEKCSFKLCFTCMGKSHWNVADDSEEGLLGNLTSQCCTSV